MRASDARQPIGSESNPEDRWCIKGLEVSLTCDKIALDLSWLKDKLLRDSDNIPAPA